MKAGIITVSDKGYAGEREDLSGKEIMNLLKGAGHEAIEYTIVADEEDMIYKAIIRMCDECSLDIVLTTGGTGFSKRDVTPEATSRAIERFAPGICEAIRYNSLSITKRAMLSRAVSGIRGETLIINLPGSPKAVRESLEFVMDSVEHGVDILKGVAGECARK
ncbi:molybdenum cofactor synthesis domain-containing protein [Peptoclostridium litorale DSM 5388]|uniref:Molybdopterin adenylyltransferase Mog n=1 Tax=Peptoclostridium litorale DSM 5388 TaxID=1121324 RepID=A0A069RCS6_PEPLI|nr:MogA/MoaB family molybdenum cofactor biosynthesis protein [Peptoclostridium litorale]KDR94864.1 molybdopterin adenylyltransferase Mog [Peptoclostridium litorale DSM 5388]SIN94393.1 molybdenum cofactor synthesis domain-containing protein [Peptoclostridium litorale DSM 5388]